MEQITDIEAEQRIISAMLHSETACVEAISNIHEDDFYRPVNRDIFLLTKDLFIRGVKPGLIEVMKEAHTLGLLQKEHDIDEFRYIAEQYIEDENIGYWLSRVKQTSKGRKAQNLIRKYSQEIEQPSLDIPEFIQQAGSDFMALAMDTDTEKIETGEDIATLGKKIVKENVEKWRKLQDDAKFLGQVPLEGVTTGIKKLDLLTLGYKPGDLIILGAQTGHGKTAFALQTSMSVSVEAKQPMLYINTEMRREQIAYRWGSIISQLPMQQIRTGSLSNEQLHHVLNSFSILGKEFLTSYMPNLTPNKLQSLARKAKLQYNIQFLILDYVGRMEKRDPKYQEWQVLEDIVKSCKILAQNLEIAVMVLVQLNEDGTLQGAKRMKNECDVMLKLIPICENLNDEEELREAQGKYERKTKSQYEPFNYKLWIDKSRDSKAGLSIPLVFDMERQQIREAQEV